MSKLKVLILTVKEYPDRMPNILSLIDQHTQIGLSCEILYGVNGRNIQVTDTGDPAVKNLTYEGRTLQYDCRIRANGQKMSPGELGCAWSHIHAMEALVSDPEHDMYLILEDDAAIVQDLSSIANHLQNLPTEFDICRLSKSVWYPFLKESQINEYYYSHSRRYTNCTIAYVISKLGAQKILKFTNGGIGLPSDNLLSESYIHLSDLTSYVPNNFLYDQQSCSSIIGSMLTP